MLCLATCSMLCVTRQAEYFIILAISEDAQGSMSAHLGAVLKVKVYQPAGFSSVMLSLKAMGICTADAALTMYDGLSCMGMHMSRCSDIIETLCIHDDLKHRSSPGIAHPQSRHNLCPKSGKRF